MPIEKTAKIWMDGELVDWDDARIHVLTHTLHYGSGVFEGIRAYPTAAGPAVFRLTDHMRRLLQLRALLHDGRPVLARGARRGDEGDDPGQPASSPATSGRSRSSATARWGSTRCRAPVNVSIAVWPWGTYLGDEGDQARRAHEGVVVAPHGPQREPGGGQGHGHLHQLEPGQGRGAARPATTRRSCSTRTASSPSARGENLFVVKDGVLSPRRCRRARSRASRVTR